MWIFPNFVYGPISFVEFEMEKVLFFNMLEITWGIHLRFLKLCLVFTLQFFPLKTFLEVVSGSGLRFIELILVKIFQQGISLLGSPGRPLRVFLIFNFLPALTKRYRIQK